MHVRIFSPSKTAMQSGRAKTGNWRLEGVAETRKTPNNLMGWPTASDTNQQIQLNFPSQEEAIAYAESKGWQYTVLPAQEKTVKPKSYAANFMG